MKANLKTKFQRKTLINIRLKETLFYDTPNNQMVSFYLQRSGKITFWKESIDLTVQLNDWLRCHKKRSLECVYLSNRLNAFHGFDLFGVQLSDISKTINQ